MNRFPCFFIEPVGGHGGMNYYNYGLGLGLLESGARVTLFTSPETNEVSQPGFKIVKSFAGVYGGGGKVLRFFRYFNAVLSSVYLIRRQGGKFVHLHFFQYSILEFVTCILARVFGLKIVSTIHDVESFSGGKVNVLHRAVLALVDHFIVHNEFSKRELLAYVCSSKAGFNCISVIPHGNYMSYVNLRSKCKSRIDLGLDQCSEVILFFGQIKAVKGLDVLLRAMPLILDVRPNVKLLIAGKVWKDSFEKYTSIIEELGISGSVVQHIKYIPDTDVDKYYSSADVVALPYKKIYQSGVLLMAMSYGCVTVSSRLPAMEEIIEDQANGYLFESENSSDLAVKLLAALSSSNSGLVSLSAIKTMNENFCWRKIAELHLEVYGKYA